MAASLPVRLSRHFWDRFSRLRRREPLASRAETRTVRSDSNTTRTGTCRNGSALPRLLFGDPICNRLGSIPAIAAEHHRRDQPAAGLLVNPRTGHPELLGDLVGCEQWAAHVWRAR